MLLTLNLILLAVLLLFVILQAPIHIIREFIIIHQFHLDKIHSKIRKTFFIYFYFKN